MLSTILVDPQSGFVFEYEITSPINNDIFTCTPRGQTRAYKRYRFSTEHIVTKYVNLNAMYSIDVIKESSLYTATNRAAERNQGPRGYTDTHKHTFKY